MLAFLRDARWLNDVRCTAYARAFCAASAVGIVVWVALSTQGIDRFGRQLGLDFPGFWAASRLALRGEPALAYNPMIQAATERAIFAGRGFGNTAFFHPPTFLLLCLPLSLLPYLGSLAVWEFVTGFAWLRAVQAVLGRRVVAPILAFPAVLVTLSHGQSSFLTAALFGAGAVALRRRPVLAGLCFGCLAIDPQLAVLVPVLLLLRRDWLALAVAVATAVVLAAISLLLFGAITWQAFLHLVPLAGSALEHGLIPPGAMPSVFGAVRELGGNVAAAYAAQATAALCVCAALAWAQRRRPVALALAMLTACGTLLATPFVLDYDLTLLSLPLAWLFAVGRRDGFRPWEKLTLAVGFLLPILSRAITLSMDVPVAPLVLVALFALLLRRAMQPGPALPGRGAVAHSVVRAWSP